MKFEIWGAEESWLTNYQNARALFKASKMSDENIEALIGNQGDKDTSIVKIKGDRAEIQIRGYLSQDGPDFIDRMLGYGGVSYRELVKAARELNDNSMIRDVDLLMDTPGGMVKGCDNAWKELMSLAESKNLTAINYGLLASAGYYLASAADQIHSTSETNETGSIGVMVVGIDWSKYDEKHGIKEVVIVSKNAPDKHVDIGSDKGKNILQKKVDVFERFFMERISAGRGAEIEHIKKNFGRGDLLVAKSPVEGEPDALSVGMIDQIYNLDAKCDRRRKKKGAAASKTNQKHKKGERKMTFKEFLAANPEAKAEHDRLMDEKYQDGLKDGEKRIEARLTQAFNVLSSDTVYPKQIKDIAVAVAKGEKSPDTLEAVIAMYDMNSEKQKSDAAKEGTKKTPETPGQQLPPKSEDGVIRNEDDFKAAMDDLKKVV
jgi:ClpP class serine protease